MLQSGVGANKNLKILCLELWCQPKTIVMRYFGKLEEAATENSTTTWFTVTQVEMLTTVPASVSSRCLWLPWVPANWTQISSDSSRVGGWDFCWCWCLLIWTEFGDWLYSSSTRSSVYLQSPIRCVVSVRDYKKNEAPLTHLKPRKTLENAEDGAGERGYSEKGNLR